MKVVDIDIHDERVQFVEAKPGGWAGYVKVNDLFKALDEAGVPPAKWPNLPTDNRCLQRSFEDNRPPGKRNLCRPLPKGRGWSLVIENGDALDLEAAEELRRVGAESDIEMSHSVELTGKVERAEDDNHLSTLNIWPESHPLVPLIKETYKFHRGTDDQNLGMFKASEDLSVWFSQTIIPWVKGVATRSRGGSYYVLRGEGLRRLESVCRALESVSVYKTTDMKLPNGEILKRTKTIKGGRIILKPELCTTAAVEVLIDSIVNEMDKEIDKLDAKLRDGKLGSRALDTQASNVDKLGEKLKEFENMLGIALTDTRERLSEAEAGVGMARLKVEAEKEAKGEAA